MFIETEKWFSMALSSPYIYSTTILYDLLENELWWSHLRWDENSHEQGMNCQKCMKTEQKGKWTRGTNGPKLWRDGVHILLQMVQW